MKNDGRGVVVHDRSCGMKTNYVEGKGYFGRIEMNETIVGPFPTREKAKLATVKYYPSET